jgi:polyisoprenyl-phosphate glycosyltransferase
LREVLGNKAFELQIVYVNDGSNDRTLAILHTMAARDPGIVVVALSRNFGHQPAVSAGLRFADGDAIAIIDADLQDPPEVILDMLEKWKEGYDVVYGVRKQRKESIFKRLSYALFYRIFRGVASIDIPLDAGDFSLIDSRVLTVLNGLPENSRYLRGLRAWAGFRQTGLAYERASRAAGETKYPLHKLIRLASDGIFNFSTVPLTIVFVVGLGTALLAIVGLVFVVVQRLFDIRVLGVAPDDVPGFAALALMILFIGGVQMASIGLLGEYIGRIYMEVKGRPTYLVDRVTRSGDRQQDQDTASSG